MFSKIFIICFVENMRLSQKFLPCNAQDRGFRIDRVMDALVRNLEFLRVVVDCAIICSGNEYIDPVWEKRFLMIFTHQTPKKRIKLIVFNEFEIKFTCLKSKDTKFREIPNRYCMHAQPVRFS